MSRICEPTNAERERDVGKLSTGEVKGGGNINSQGRIGGGGVDIVCVPDESPAVVSSGANAGGLSPAEVSPAGVAPRHKC